MNDTDARLLRRYPPKDRMVAVIAAWMGGHISEGMACKVLDIAPIGLRECAQDYERVADVLCKRYSDTGRTINDDIAAEHNPHAGRTIYD